MHGLGNFCGGVHTFWSLWVSQVQPCRHIKFTLPVPEIKATTRNVSRALPLPRSPSFVQPLRPKHIELQCMPKCDQTECDMKACVLQLIQVHASGSGHPRGAFIQLYCTFHLPRTP
eukprot:263918-Amphidinium_carterae.2